jgi:hypothetical protein
LEKTRQVFIRPVDHEPACYLEPTLGGATFVSKVEVLVNGEPVDQPSLGEHGYLYQKINRTFCSDRLRQLKYGGKLAPLISSTSERVMNGTDATKDDERLKASLRLLQHQDKLASQSNVLFFGVDGIFPFDCKSNICQELFGDDDDELSNRWLPPGIDLNIRVHKRIPFDSLVERPDLSDADYYKTGPVSAAAEKIWTLTDAFILYESMTLQSSGELQTYRLSHAKYYVDVPRLRLESMKDGVKMTTNDVLIPKGTKFVSLSWAHQDQLFFNATRKKNLSSRLTFPPNAVHINVDLTGRENILQREGLTNFGVEKAFSSPSCHEFHRQLQSKKLYSRSFEKMFPLTGKSYDQAILLDLSPYDLKDDTTMTVTIKYDDTFSAAKIYFCSVTVGQGCYSYRDKEKKHRGFTFEDSLL